MALIGLLFVSGAVGCLSNAAFGWLAFGVGLIGFRDFDCVWITKVSDVVTEE